MHSIAWRTFCPIYGQLKRYKLKYKLFFKKESGDGIITFTATPAARWPLVQETGLQGEKNPGDGGAHQVGQRPRRYRT